MATSTIIPARTGRQKQVYEKNVRQVAGCVPINPATKQVLLISSRTNRGEWSLPKGGWETDESKAEAAMRETYEEAGVRGQITSLLGYFNHSKLIAETGLPAAGFWFFEMVVNSIEEDWPEKLERDRQWFAFEEAMRHLARRPFMQHALAECSLRPAAASKCL